MIGMAIFMRGLWAVSTLSRSEIEISGIDGMARREEGVSILERAINECWSFEEIVFF